MKKKVLVLCYSELNLDPRLRHQVQWLKDDYDVTVSGLKNFEDIPVRFIPITPQFSIDKFNAQKQKIKTIDFHLSYPTPLRKLFSLFIKGYLFIQNTPNLLLSEKQQYENTYWFNNVWYGRCPDERMDYIDSLKGEYFDFILANDIETLPLALKISNGKSKVILDSHEYHPGESDEKKDWVKKQKAVVTYLCKEYIPKVDLMFTVGHNISKKFEAEFHKKSFVITNAPSYSANLNPIPVGEKIKIIHHGLCVNGRNIGAMIEMMKYTDERFTLDLMLLPVAWEKEYYEELKTEAVKYKNVKMLLPVPTSEITQFTNQYDIGLFLLPPVNFNYTNALPNKFFEFVQARLAIAIGPSPEMAKYINKYELGIISDDFSPQSLAKTINQLTPEQIWHHKQQSHKYAYDLSAEKNKQLLLSKVKELI